MMRSSGTNGGDHALPTSIPLLSPTTSDQQLTDWQASRHPGRRNGEVSEIRSKIMG